MNDDTIELTVYPINDEHLRQIQNCTHWKGQRIISITVDPPKSDVLSLTVVVQAR
jgi:hypothetical protein